jgi:hypothetical protein
MRMLVAGLALVMVMAACQRRTAGAPGGADVETGSKASADSAATPQMQNPPASTDTTKMQGANPADTSKKH